ncbi:MAG: homoaconitate hydratase [Candidatus Acidulodesulfobacterium ferriphilum]|jgi:homocitrate synthase NifV|uniref:Homoaconitate hydratase n=1 Tax=Candidatus Acidulodesulfobacterium ferriphilum TaxID=2597223 RepID=A0A519BDX4_9DELT|nr:MAG: homoaconitate hydratase [Candidatus Acidulodesulfobacterium ferriphilum]
MEKIIINDTTLRDGEQTAGIVFSASEKILIAKMLDETGADEIEAGIPVMGGHEKKAIKEINELGLKAKIVGWNRAKMEDIYSSLDIGLKVIHISIPVSQIHMEYKLKKDFQYIKTSLIDILKILNKEGVQYSVGGEDSSRAEENTIIEIIKIAKEEGAYKYRYSDTVGMLNPLKTFENIKKLTSLFKDIIIEIHTHNDFGMASANSVSALKAGAGSLSGSISGIGERAGNCALEEVIAYFNFIENKKIKFDLIKAKILAKLIAKITKRPMPVSKPIFGKNIFYHEAGIHTDGILKNPINYEAYPPEYVGAERKLLAGKHSGSAAIKHKLNKMGLQINNEDAKNILDIVKAESVKLKRCLTDKEVESIYNDYKMNAGF